MHIDSSWFGRTGNETYYKLGKDSIADKHKKSKSSKITPVDQQALDKVKALTE